MCYFVLPVNIFAFTICSLTEGDETGVMDSLMEALQSGAAFRDRRKRTPRNGKAVKNSVFMCQFLIFVIAVSLSCLQKEILPSPLVVYTTQLALVCHIKEALLSSLYVITVYSCACVLLACFEDSWPITRIEHKPE